ncbi:MAG: hypothetical protein ACD_20C00420G0002 [uncultured bacterium]|nr:MAG: hypothetical protein ACD_20C00420G0002 [uncultured bacterium]HBH17936.1 hypothetical protein [Cyanobacteria bacterium UBA9579]
MFFKKYYSNKAFTLAEVLVTLAIIGVVAALSIPALIQNIQHQNAVVKVKKYQTLLDNVVKRYAADNGCIGNLANCNVFASNSVAAWNELKPYFSVIQDCGAATGQGCFALGVMYKYLNGNNWIIVDDNTSIKAVLADGASIEIMDYNTGNCNTDYSRSDNTSLFYTCGWIIIDTNGSKGPNQVGRDAFGWWITKQGVYPAGIYDGADFTHADGSSHCNPKDSGMIGYGWGCTAKILKENAVNY